MSAFIDASAAIALIAREDGHEALADALGAEADLLCSPLSAWETVAGLCRSHNVSPEIARARVASFLDALDCRFVAIGEPEFEHAVDAYADYGKGRHPARLNMGDCFAYACAKVHGARLLYKGDEFARTDLA